MCVVQLVDLGHVGEVDPRFSILLLIAALYWLLPEGSGCKGLQEDGPGLTADRGADPIRGPRNSTIACEASTIPTLPT